MSKDLSARYYKKKQRKTSKALKAHERYYDLFEEKTKRKNMVTNNNS